MPAQRLFPAAFTATFPTAPVAALGLIAGYGVAAATGNRTLGGVLLFGIGAVCAWAWYSRINPLLATALVVIYLAAFALSHILTKAIGAWPAVLTVAAVTAAAAWLIADRRVPSRETPGVRGG